MSSQPDPQPDLQLPPLKFATFNSRIDTPFYHNFFKSKIDHDKLDDSYRPLLGLYQPSMNQLNPGQSCLMQVHPNALSSKQGPLGFIRAEGRIKNVNTHEDFKNLDKQAILTQAGQQIWDAIKDGTIYSAPSMLSSYTVVSYADLKRYKFTYWFGFPALHSDPAWKRVGPVRHMTPEASTTLVDHVGTWRYKTDAREHGFFLAKKLYGSPAIDDDHPNTGEDEEGVYTWGIGSLGDFETGFFKGVPQKYQFIVFVDPSSYPSDPGWPLRNLLVLMRQRYHLQKAQVICYRDTQDRRHEARSIILDVQMDTPSTTTGGTSTDVAPPSSLESTKVPRITGWERTPAGRLNARVANLAEALEPKLLADQAIDLNLKLMKWRIAPALDLDLIKNTKCLLLGAGTLGGYVARNLLGWGVRHITFVDNGTVSYSNPVRQPLFNFSDCLNGGAHKAIRSAEALREVYPGVKSSGHVLSVPMLGHPIPAVDEEQARAEYEQLAQLVEEHDAVFLLLDTREARWLPTVMGKSMGKIVLNAALGFDTYVVMRHGAKPAGGKEEKTLGCYFCNDVVAPGDSIKDLTLDQQCTVTRPGISTTASALLVELFTSILQHPLCANAPAPVTSSSSTGNSAYSLPRDPPEHPLGLLPHQIRGFFSSFQNMMISGENYPSCSACSDPVVNAFETDGWKFVKRAVNEKGWVEELSGLAEVQRRAEEVMGEVGGWGSEEEDAEDEGEGELV